MTATLKSRLISLVELSRTNENAAGYLQQILSETTDRFDRQQIELAIRHAERNAASL